MQGRLIFSKAVGFAKKMGVLGRVGRNGVQGSVVCGEARDWRVFLFMRANL